MPNTTTHADLITEQVRAWDLRPTDTLVDPDTGVAFPITTVTVDEPGRAGRQVHVVALVLGTRSMPLNQFVTSPSETPTRPIPRPRTSRQAPPRTGTPSARRPAT